ncbi:hypothetical protein KHA95_14040 [Bacillus sp. FJAT-50079]|nr:hypothetical protein [Bacillus sp. FJAT-50079]
MIFSIPIVAIITEHLRKSNKIKMSLIQEQLQLEKIKHENYLLETEKLKLELEKMQLTASNEDPYKLVK